MSLDFQRLEQVLAEAAARTDPTERAAYLAQACGGDRELRGEVERLLAANEKAGDFLECGVRNAEGDLGMENAEGRRQNADTDLVEKPGMVIGRYKLLEEIGEGGFGVVYMAEQAEPVQRKVALKVVKAGMDTREVVARFEAERQALALMDHPSIARVFDGGITQGGRPYFVMELVQGIPITAFCDQRKLSTPERLRLFIQVCHAVQHAHQKGIIHRDLKPSNILVTLVDGDPVPKVIDFGVAKALGQKLTDKTLFTGFLKMVGTPAYMSPEQADLSGVDIDTRADIYALGVLLYELLTGVTPFDSETLRNAALDEIRRLIREVEPVKPSTRLTKERLRAAASGRSAIGNPQSAIDRDLDWIVMKCLEKERGRRYETANALAADIERHLEHEPITARPPSKLYRLSKLVQRNKLPFAAAAAVAASLVMGLTGATMLFFRERTARQQADEQAAIARAVNDFLQNDLLRQADSRAQADARFIPNPNLTVREALERASQRIGDRFGNQPLTELAIRAAISDALRGLGQTEQALPHLHRAVELSQSKLGPEHPLTLKYLDQLAVVYSDAGRQDLALPLFERGLALRTRKLGSNHADTLTTMNNLAWAYQGAGKREQAIQLAERTLGLRKTALGPAHPDTLDSMASLAIACQFAGYRDRALPLLEETLKLRTATLGPDHPDTLNSVNNLVAAYCDAGKLEQARLLCEETLKKRTAALGPDHGDTLSSKHNLGMVYSEIGALDQAIPLLEETLRTKRATRASDRASTLLTMNGLAGAYQNAGRPQDAVTLFDEALELSRRELGTNHAITIRLMCNTASAYQDAGRLDDALRLHQEATGLAKARLGPDHPQTSRSMSNLAWAYAVSGDVERASSLFTEALKAQNARLGPEHPDTLVTLANFANCRLRQGNYTNAETMARECFNRREKLTPNHWRTFEVQTTLGMTLLGQKRYAEAESLLVQGYKGLKGSEQTIPTGSRHQLNLAAQALLEVLEARGNPNEAARVIRELRLTQP